MRDNSQVQDNRRDGFPTTRWSLVAAAAGSNAAQAHDQALCDLCEMYWYPLYAFVRRQGYEAEDAQDLTQGFFARVLEKDYLRDFRPERARFRTFLLASIRHFMANERDFANAQKRGGGRVSVPLDLAFADAEQRYSVDAGHNLTPEKIFEKQWALALVERTQMLLEQECERAGKEKQFTLLKPFVNDDDLAPYRQIALDLETSEGAVKVAVHRLRRRFREILRDEIAQTVSGPEQVDEEIRFLFGALRF
jgi:DNA-directed RNA polymerase specialized sigma24 family protein